MLLSLIETIRRWESHCSACVRCCAFDKAPAYMIVGGTKPCSEGQGIIHQLLHLLEKGV